MPYRITADGMIVADSIEEAVHAAKYITGHQPPARKLRLVTPKPGLAKARPKAKPKAHSKPPKASHRLTKAELYQNLNPEQQKLLDLLAERGSASLEDLRTGLKMKGKYQLSGLLSGLQRTLTRLGVDIAQVWTKEKSGHGAEQVITYTAGPTLVGSR